MIKYHVENKLALLEYPRIAMNSTITRTLADAEGTPSETIYMSRNISNWNQYTDNVVHALNMYNMATIELIGKDCYNKAFEAIDDGKYAIAVVRDNYVTEDEKPAMTLRIVISDDPTGADARNMLIELDGKTEDDKSTYFSFSLSDNGIVTKNIEKYTYDKFCFTVAYSIDPTIFFSTKEINNVQGYNYAFFYGVEKNTLEGEDKSNGEEVN